MGFFDPLGGKLQAFGFNLLPVEFPYAAGVSTLAAVHSGPFDRLLIHSANLKTEQPLSTTRAGVTRGTASRHFGNPLHVLVHCPTSNFHAASKEAESGGVRRMRGPGPAISRTGN